MGRALTKSATIASTIAVIGSLVMAHVVIPNTAIPKHNASKPSSLNNRLSTLKAAAATMSGLTPKASGIIAALPTPAESSAKKVISGVAAHSNQIVAFGLALPARVALK